MLLCTTGETCGKGIPHPDHVAPKGGGDPGSHRPREGVLPQEEGLVPVQDDELREESISSAGVRRDAQCVFAA